MPEKLKEWALGIGAVFGLLAGIALVIYSVLNYPQPNDRTFGGCSLIILCGLELLVHKSRLDLARVRSSSPKPSTKEEEEIRSLRGLLTKAGWDIEEERGRAGELAKECDALRAQNAQYAREIEALKAGRPNDAPQPEPPSSSFGGDDKFTAVKRRFAKLYHPNTNAHEGMEKLIREAFFKEFWSELETIEKG